MIKTLLLSFTSLVLTQINAQSWTKVTNIADTVDIKAVAQINNRVLISGTLKGDRRAPILNHFTSPDGNSEWKKLPTFQWAGNYLFGLPC